LYADFPKIQVGIWREFSPVPWKVKNNEERVGKNVQEMLCFVGEHV